MSHLSAPLLVRVAPIIFVMLWATGFVGAKYGMQDAEPFTFLAIRFALTVLVLLPFVLPIILRERASHKQLWHSFLSGCLVHGGYLGSVFYAVHQGIPAGISSLVVALQPFMTALIAWQVMGDRLSPAKAFCFLIALFGVFVVLFPQLDISSAIPGVNGVTIVACLFGTFCISLGSVYQKRFVTSISLWSSTAVQFAGAASLMLVLSLFFETQTFNWTFELAAVMIWLVFVLSIGAVTLLMFLIRTGDSASVASLFYLVPVVAMLMTWVLFDERLVFMQLVGSGIVIASVAVASRFK